MRERRNKNASFHLVSKLRRNYFEPPEIFFVSLSNIKRRGDDVGGGSDAAFVARRTV